MPDNVVASRDYFEFYMEGIHERKPRELRAVDTELIAARVIALPPSSRTVMRDAIRDAIRAECTTAISSLMEGRSKTRWMNDHRAVIFTREVVPSISESELEAAYAAYCDGRVDSMVLTLEERVLSDLAAELR